MKDITGLVDMAFGDTQEISAICTHLEHSPGLTGHGLYPVNIADAAVSALAHVASMTVTFGGSHHARQAARESTRGARQQLRRLSELLRVVHAQRYIGDEEAFPLAAKIKEADALLMAISFELAERTW